jgi:hypothetical protein
VLDVLVVDRGRVVLDVDRVDRGRTLSRGRS